MVLVEPEAGNALSLMSATKNLGIVSLEEKYGIEAVDAPGNTVYRYASEYNVGDQELLWFLNGELQCPVAGDYTETDYRTITEDAALVAEDRLIGMSLSRKIASLGGVDYIDRPPAGAGAGPYTLSGSLYTADDLYVFLNGVLQREGAAYDYVADITNNQFTFNAAPVAGSTIVAIVIRPGYAGYLRREVYDQGPFPGTFNLTGDAVNFNQYEALLFINGQLQSPNHDFDFTATDTVNVTRTVPGTNDVQVVIYKKAIPCGWRE